MTTPYDLVAYPAGIFPSSHPERLAAVARMHGLNPPPAETARVLEIGGGDGFNLLGPASAYPRAHFLSFDLSSEAVRRGQALIDRAGFSNIHIIVADIMDAVYDLKQPFDYIICHGVYSWVPEPVREAILELISRVMAPDGVAFLSYNALPGGHLRVALRDMLKRQVAAIEDPEEKLAAARAFLEDYAASESSIAPFGKALRAEAEDMLNRRMGILFHDELGDIFEPQALCEVAGAAGRHGLQLLGDAGEGPQGDGFLPDNATDLSTDAVVRAGQLFDDKTVRFFRQSLFVRADQQPERRFNADHFKTFFVSSHASYSGGNRFVSPIGEFIVDDPPTTEILKRIIAASPDRLPMSEVTSDPSVIRSMLGFSEAGLVTLHTTPAPFATQPVERPKVSDLVRAQVELGYNVMVPLSQRVISITQEGPKAMIAMLDGERTLDELRVAWADNPVTSETKFDDAYDMAIKFALVQRPDPL